MANEDETRRPEEASPIEPPEQLVPDPFVEMFVPDPSQPLPPTVALVGLLGRRAPKRAPGGSTLAAFLSATRSSKKRTCYTA
jgi:hypothetical protein